MTLRKELKKRLSLLKRTRQVLPRMIDCSEVYGDNSFTQEDYPLIDKEISEIEAAIRGIDEYHLGK